MEVLWTHGSLSPREAHDFVGRPRNLAYATILTIVQRLHAKGLLERSEYGRTYRYGPLMSRDDYGAHQAQRLAESLVRKAGEPVRVVLDNREGSTLHDFSIAQIPVEGVEEDGVAHGGHDADEYAVHVAAA